MKSVAMTEETVVQTTMELEMVIVILKTSFRCVIMMEETVVNLRESMIYLSYLQTN